jgi:hypothetical protein
MEICTTGMYTFIVANSMCLTLKMQTLDFRCKMWLSHYHTVDNVMVMTSGGLRSSKGTVACEVGR